MSKFWQIVNRQLFIIIKPIIISWSLVLSFYDFMHLKVLNVLFYHFHVLIQRLWWRLVKIVFQLFITKVVSCDTHGIHVSSCLIMTDCSFESSSILFYLIFGVSSLYFTRIFSAITCSAFSDSPLAADYHTLDLLLHSSIILIIWIPKRFSFF